MGGSSLFASENCNNKSFTRSSAINFGIGKKILLVLRTQDRIIGEENDP